MSLEGAYNCNNKLKCRRILFNSGIDKTPFFGITSKNISSFKKADGCVVGSEICKKISQSVKKGQNPVTNVNNMVKELKNKII